MDHKRIDLKVFCLLWAGEYLSRGPCQLIAECVCVDDGEGVSVCVFEACCQPAVRGEQSSSTP